MGDCNTVALIPVKKLAGNLFSRGKLYLLPSNVAISDHVGGK